MVVSALFVHVCIYLFWSMSLYSFTISLNFLLMVLILVLALYYLKQIGIINNCDYMFAW